jgi:hypothetical protein
VRLLLVYYNQLDYKKDVRQIMMESAETYAQRLVEAGQEAVPMSWSDEVELGCAEENALFWALPCC